MGDWFPIVAGVLGGLAIPALAFFAQMERSRRVRAEERVGALSRGSESARATARVLHEIAREKEDALEELQDEHERTLSEIGEKEEELDDAAGDLDKIAGLFNKHIREKGNG